jgi:hypothetical protein
MHNLLQLKSEAEADCHPGPAPVTTTDSTATIGHYAPECQRDFRRLVALYELTQEPCDAGMVRAFTRLDAAAMVPRGWLQLRAVDACLGLNLYEPAGPLLDELQARAAARWRAA